MTTSHESESAHLHALPCNPQAAYALGMLHMLQRIHAPSSAAEDDGSAALELEKLAEEVLAFLQDEQIAVSAKHALLSEIEHANSLLDVAHAMAARRMDSKDRDEDAAVWRALSANQEQDAVDGHASPHAALATGECNEQVQSIPEALGCAICCDELMVKPASLLCGHSFCKRCLDMWLKSCPNCPSCRQSVTRSSISTATTAVNVALHDMMVALFPEKLKALEDRDHMARLDVLRVLIARSIETGQPIRELVAQQATQLFDGEHDPQADVSELLELDVALKEKLMAAEMRERLRQEKALRESSRRRHLVAYCNALPAASNSHVRMLTSGYAPPPPAPALPNVQSHRPVKKYVPPPPQKKPFFGSLLRRMQPSSTVNSN